jgi:DNA-binding response OmpR family regulator
MTNSTSTILLVEDDRGYAMIFKRALKDSEIGQALVHSLDCKDALDYLGDRSEELPCLIITDLNIPGMNGFEFLKALKSDDTLMAIPVVILSGSLKEDDVAESRKLGAADYIVKPDDYKSLVGIIGNLHERLVADELLV